MVFDISFKTDLVDRELNFETVFLKVNDLFFSKYQEPRFYQSLNSVSLSGWDQSWVKKTWLVRIELFHFCKDLEEFEN